MKRLTNDKDLNKYLGELVKAGWVAKKDGGNHIRLVSPEGLQVRAATTPGDANAVNAVRRLVRNREKWGSRHHSGALLQ